MPLAALTPVLNDLLQKDGTSNSNPYPSQQQARLSVSSAGINADGTTNDYLRRPSLQTNPLSSNLSQNNNIDEEFDRMQRHSSHADSIPSSWNVSNANFSFETLPSPQSTSIPSANQQHSITTFRSTRTLKREDSFLQKFSNRYGYRGLGPVDSSKRNLRRTFDKDEPIQSRFTFIQRILRTCNYFVISTDESFLFYWLIFLNIFVLYNLWFSIARQAFDPLQRDYATIWQILDYLADTFYFLDIAIQFRTGYLEQGLLVYDHYKLAMNYLRSSRFIFDLVSLTPLDLFQIRFGSIPILRFPRFFKIYRTFQLYYLQESRTVYPNTYRVINLFHILLLLGHWLASFYFMVSKAEGFVGYWSYPKPVGNFSQLTKMYLRCLYWSTLTLTTIGDLPPPETNWQWLKNFSNKRYAFLISVHLFAVFVIAIIVGQVGNVITNRNASRLEFERLLDSAKQYMRSHNVPKEMQRRVQRWYDYSWSRGRMSGAGDVHSIKLLPDKLKTELALHVNLGTLKKVTIFQECQPEFLHDLVLKMRAYIFTPGDIICRKGEVAREMFIIADGVLEVVNDKNDVLTRLVAGDFFGEIGILNIDGANRRTADVRSVGYSELFSLSKEDVLEGCRDYPEAERKLYEYAQHRLGYEKAKKEASEKMKGAFNTLTSIASSLTTNPPTTTLSTIDEANEHEEKTKSSIRPTETNSNENFSFSSSSHPHVDDLMSNIEHLVNDKIKTVERLYRQEIAELKDQNQRKDLRIKLLEQKIQKLQKTLINRNRLWFEDEEN